MVENKETPISYKEKFLNIDFNLIKNAEIHYGVFYLSEEFYKTTQSLGIERSQKGKDFMIFNTYKNLGTENEESIEIIIPILVNDGIYNIRRETARGRKKWFEKDKDDQLVEVEEGTEPISDNNLKLYFEMMRDFINISEDQTTPQENI